MPKKKRDLIYILPEKDIRIFNDSYGAVKSKGEIVFLYLHGTISLFHSCFGKENTRYCKGTEGTHVTDKDDLEFLTKKLIKQSLKS